MVKCQDIVQGWFAKHYRCYGTAVLAPEAKGSSPPVLEEHRFQARAEQREGAPRRHAAAAEGASAA